MKRLLSKVLDQKLQHLTAQEIANVLGVKKKLLLSTARHAEGMYTPISLRKKDGVSFRSIQAPDPELKLLQRLILDKILKSIPLPTYVYGFGPRKSIIENALLHNSGKYLLNVDIQDFFDSIHYKKIERIFIELGLSKEVALSMTQLTTLNESLPQGAPTSPYLASLALSSMDARLKALCKNNRLKYSRYFDDITISGGHRAHIIFPTIQKIIRNEGYRVHTSGEKIRMSGPDDPKIVTGITITPNGDLEVPYQDIENYLNELTSHGLSSLRTDDLEKEKESLRGKINFVKQVSKTQGQLLLKKYNSIQW